jgi:hypothetical protein
MCVLVGLHLMCDDLGCRILIQADGVPQEAGLGFFCGLGSPRQGAGLGFFCGFYSTQWLLPVQFPVMLLAACSARILMLWCSL